MRWPLRIQIMLPMLLLVLGTLLTTTLVNAGLAANRTRAGIDQQLRSVVETLNSSRFPLTENVLSQMRGLSGADFAVTDQSGRITASSIDLPEDGLEVHSESPLRVQAAPILTINERPFYHLIQSLDRPAPANQQKVMLHIFYPQADYREAWQDAILPPTIVGLGAVLIGVVSSVQIASHVTRSIHRFRDGVGQLLGGEFHPLHVPTRNDEIRDLALATNQLAEKLSMYESDVRSHERLRTLGQLGAGMAHQLRNAVTGCQLALDIHSQDCSESESESWQVANQQLQLMDEYLNRFLSWGRESHAPAVTFDAKLLVDDAISLTRPLAQHAKVALEWIPPASPISLHGDRHALCQMLINIILNGIEASAREATQTSTSGFTPARVAVELQTITAKAEADSTSESDQPICVIEVRDSGSGPNDQISSRMFEPLVTDKPEGTGIGLSVALDAAHAQGGNIRWERFPQETCFRIELPLRNDSITESNS